MINSPRLLLGVGAFAVMIALACPSRAWASWPIAPSTPTSAQSESAGAPGAPANPSAACVSTLSDEIKVSWSAVTRANNYSVYDETTLSGSYSLIASGVTQTTWTSSGLATGTYTFEVRAYSGSNWSGPNSAATGDVTIVSVGVCQSGL
jgi:hypothetical protein